MNAATLTLRQPPLSSVEIQQRQAAAERFIEQSGDGVAMRALGGLRRDPVGWFDRLKAAATSQTTLKVALGVFMGVIAADAALALLRSGSLNTALADIDAALAGGNSDAPVKPTQSPGHVTLTDDTSLTSEAILPAETGATEFDVDGDLDSAIDGVMDSLLG